MQSFPHLFLRHPTVARAAGAAAVAAAAVASGASEGFVDQQLPFFALATTRLQPGRCTPTASCGLCSCCCESTAVIPCRGRNSNSGISRKTQLVASCSGCQHQSLCCCRCLRHSSGQSSTQCAHPGSCSESDFCVLTTQNCHHSGGSSSDNTVSRSFYKSRKGHTVCSKEEGTCCGTAALRLISASHAPCYSGNNSSGDSTGVDRSLRSGSGLTRRSVRGTRRTSRGRSARWGTSAQACLPAAMGCATQSLRRGDWCSIVLRQRKFAASCEGEPPAPAKPGDSPGSGQHAAHLHAHRCADSRVTAVADAFRAAVSGTASDVGNGHAGPHSDSTLDADGWASFSSPQRWSGSRSKLEYVRPTTRSKGGTPLGLNGAAAAPAAETRPAASAAQRMATTSTRGTPAACIATGAALHIPEAAAAAGAGGGSECRRRSRAEDAAVDLAAEVGRAVEGLRRLQEQQHQQQQRDRQQGQEQKPLSDGAQEHAEGSGGRNRPWRQLALRDEDFVCLVGDSTKRRWLALLERLRPLGHISTGNSVKLYDDGNKAFTAMLHEIDAAQRDVLLETYMFDASLLACRVKDALCGAAQRGCFVVLIVDWVGSINMPFAWQKELLSSGVRLIIFNPRLFLPVFSASATWPQGSTDGPCQNVMSPIFRILRSFSASSRPVASGFSQSSSALTECPDSGNSSINHGTVTTGSGESSHNVSAKNGYSSSAMHKVTSDTGQSEDGAPQDILGSVRSHLEADKRETARAAGPSWDTGIEAPSRVLSLTRANKGLPAEETTAPHAVVRPRAFLDEKSGFTKTTDADRKAPVVLPCAPAVNQSSGALEVVRAQQGTAHEIASAAIANREVPRRLLWANKIGPVPFRDHRKILIVDGRTAFVGSLNVSEDGVGKKYGGRGFFYDLHARLRGPVVRRLQQLVLETVEISHAFDLAEQLRRHLSTTASLQTQSPLNLKLWPSDKSGVQLQREQRQETRWLLGGRWRSSVLQGRSSGAVGSHSHRLVVSHGEVAEDSTEADDDDDAEDVLIQLTGAQACVKFSLRLADSVSWPLSEAAANMYMTCVATLSYVLDTGASTQVLKSNVLHNERSIQAALQAAITNASTSVCLTSSYFIPPGFLRRALHAALSRRGVDVSLLLSGNSDVWGDVYATIYVVRKFLRAPSAPGVGSTSAVATQLRDSADHVLALDPSRSPPAVRCPEVAVATKAGFEEHVATAAGATRKTNAHTAALGGLDGSESPAAVRGATAGTNTAAEVEAADVAEAESGKATSGAAKASSGGSRALPGDAGRQVTEETQGRAGVYFLSEHHCHAKNIVVDHLWSSLGSFNFDRFSSRRNLEVLVTFFDPQIAYKLEAVHWERITEEAEEMTVEKWNRQPFIKKLLCSFCYYLTRFAGKNFFDGLSDQRSRAILKRLLVASYLDDMPAADIFLGMAWGLH